MKLRPGFKQKILNILGVLILLALLIYLSQNLLVAPDNAATRAPIGTVIY